MRNPKKTSPEKHFTKTNRRQNQETPGPGKYFSKPNRRQNREIPGSGTVRLNKFISNSGVCSRREADRLIGLGLIKVNGKVVKEMGVKVGNKDSITYNNKVLSGEKKVYLLLNKPKDHITTVDDPHGRKTVMHLIKNACKERVYPVGRLDRNTTGLLMFSNDGELAKKLTHPKNRIKKIYHLALDKPLTRNHFDSIANGVELDDGKAEVDVVAYIGEGADKNLIGIELHSGKNRVIRRLFEHLGYKVMQLDRIVYAGLTKKDIPRGKWRFLNEKEVGMLKMIPG